MSILIRGGRIVTAADDYVADVLVEGERDRADRRRSRRRRRPDDRRGRQVRPAGLHRPAHASRHAVRRHGHDRRLRVGPGIRRVRRHDLPRRLLHPGTGPDVRRGARGLAREGERQDADRLRLPHRDHRPARGGAARGARHAARAGHHLLQALHGLQERPAGRRRDALPRDGGRGGERRARDGARRERGRDRRPRPRGARARRDGPDPPRAHAAARARGRGDEPRHPPRAHRRQPALRRPRHLPRGGRADPPRPRAGLGRLG